MSAPASAVVTWESATRTPARVRPGASAWPRRRPRGALLERLPQRDRRTRLEL